MAKFTTVLCHTCVTSPLLLMSSLFTYINDIYTTQNRSENTTILPILLNITVGRVHFASFQTAAKHEFESHILTL